MSDLRVGLLGVGMMGADHALRLTHRISGARLVAVSDPATDRAQRLAAGLEDVACMSDAAELEASDDVDAVVIASPGFAHEEQVLACLERGKPVLCEKPLTMDATSSYRLVEAEAKGSRPLVQVGFMRRFDPEYAELKILLDSGELGRTLLLHNVHRNKTVSGEFRSEIIVRDSLVHEVDVCRWLFGEEIEEVTILAPAATSAAPEGVLDPQVALFRMAGGGMATTEVFVNRPGPLGAVVPGGHSNRLGGAIPSRPDGPGPGSSTGRTGRRPDPAGAKYLGAGRGASSFGVCSVRRPDARTGRRPAAGCFRPARCTSGRGGRGDPVRRSGCGGTPEATVFGAQETWIGRGGSAASFAATLSWLGKVVDVMAGTGALPRTGDGLVPCFPLLSTTSQK